MSSSITGKLNKPARQFQAGDSTGFGIRLGVKYRDPKTKQDEWTNYNCVIFAKAPAQINFYQQVLVEGAIIEVSAEQLKIDSFVNQEGNTVLTIDMLNARLGYVFNPSTNQPQPAQQGGFQKEPPQQQQPQQGVPQGGFQQQQAPRDAQGFTAAQGGFQQQAPAQQQQGQCQAPQQPPF